MRQRLLAGLRWLERWAAPTPPPFDAGLLETPLIPPLPEERSLGEQVLRRIAAERAFAVLGAPGIRAAPAPDAFVDEEIGELPWLPYFLRTLLFSKYLTYPYGLLAGYNFVVLAYCALVRRFTGVTASALAEADLEAYFAGLQHAPFRLALDEICESAALRGLSSSPLFGELLLRTAVLPGS